MSNTAQAFFTVFQGSKQLAHGSLVEVALRAKKSTERGDAALLIFEDATGKTIDLDLRGTPDDIRRRHERATGTAGETNAESEKKPRPGRPKLGVVSREITLLPRHWEWLGAQPGGASVTLRKLVEDAKKKYQDRDRVRQAQTAAHQFMTTMAGDRPGYEEALRALYAKDSKKFVQLISAWPRDIQLCLKRMAEIGA